MKILVTGANGFLGQGIVRQLLDDGMEVIASDCTAEKIDGRAEIIKGDLFEMRDPYHRFHCPDTVLHLAWRDGFSHDSEAHIEDLRKHYRFIKEMVEGGTGRVAVMGSMHEIGFYEGCVDEDTPCRPMSLYGIAKNSLREMTELLCRQHAAKWQWLRGYYIVTDDEDGNSIFSKLVRAEKKGQERFPFTSGRNQYDFLEYEEFCRQTAYAVEQEEAVGIINICSGRPEKLSDTVERFISEHGYKIRLEYGRYPDRPYDSKAIWGNDKKIQEIMKKKHDEDQ